jgi:hypothetical protein
MLKKRKIASNTEPEVIDKIKRDIETELSKKGILISGMNLNINSECISLNILINSSRRLA